MQQLINIIQQMQSMILRMLFSVMGGIIPLLEPTFPYILVCYIFVLADVYTANSLSRRAKAKFPDKASGKFRSEKFGDVVNTLIKVSVAIIMAFLAQKYVFEELPMALPNIVAAAIIFWQTWSMLENESSCSDKKWARVLQRIMVDKTERHFDIDLSELKHEENNIPGTEQKR